MWFRLKTMAKLFENSGDPDQMLHSAASDLGSALFANYHFRGLQTKMGSWLVFKKDQYKQSTQFVTQQAIFRHINRFVLFALFAYVSLSDTLVFKILGLLP